MMLACSVSYLDKSYGQGHVKITYDVSAPLGNTMDFVGETSFRGFSFEAGMNLNDNFALGIKSGLHSFYESLNKDTYTDNNVTIYGKQFRYINSIPILLTASYFFRPDAGVSPYLTVGAGAYSFQRRIDLGLYNATNDFVWNFGLQPEVGMLFSLNKSLKLNLGARYNYILENESISDQQYVSFNVGLVFGGPVRTE
ncbi:MAG: porin family protein [Bacteroidales bacterium]|nr:porin family protein [Bacteroidales bacterium]